MSEQTYVTLERQFLPRDETIEHLRGMVVTAAQQGQLVGIHALHLPQAEWLSEPIEDLFPTSGTGMDTRIRSRLLSDGYASRRDLLVAGRAKVRDTHNLGKGAIGAINEALASDFGITWQTRPLMEDVATVCANLSETSSVTFTESPIVTSSGSGTGLRHLSVQDLLDAGRGEGVVPQMTSSAWETRQRGFAMDYLDAAKIFALQFYATQLTFQEQS